VATSQEIQTASRMVERTAASIDLCHDVAQALIETGAEWARLEWMRLLLPPTEYERARRDVLSKLRSAMRELRKIRSTSISSAAIRAEPVLAGMIECCRRCPDANRKGLAKGKPFVCLVKQQAGQEPDGSYRFTLDDKGQILESK